MRLDSTQWLQQTTHCQNKCASQDASHRDKDPGRKKHHERELFCSLQPRVPEHHDGDAHEVEVREEVERQAGRDGHSGDCRLTGICGRVLARLLD